MEILWCLMEKEETKFRPLWVLRPSPFSLSVMHVLFKTLFMFYWQLSLPVCIFSDKINCYYSPRLCWILLRCQLQYLVQLCLHLSNIPSLNSVLHVSLDNVKMVLNIFDGSYCCKSFFNFISSLLCFAWLYLPDNVQLYQVVQ